MTRGQTRQYKKAFLAAFAKCGNVSQSAEAVGFDRHEHYRWLKADGEYAKAFSDAEIEAAEGLEREARRRAVDGVEEPVHYKGDRVDTVRKYSDTLLIFLMKGAMPDKYADRTKNETNVNFSEELMARLAAGRTRQTKA